MSKFTRDNYINIQGFMITDLGLKGNELILYAIIYGYSQDGISKCVSSISYICSALNITRPAAINLTERLIEKGLIGKSTGIYKGQECNQYAIIPEGSKETLLVKKLNEGSKETLPNIDNNNKDIYIGENSENESNAVKHLKKETQDITAAKFLERWKAARLHYDKKPTHISKLYFNEAQNFKTLVKEGYTLKDFDEAIAGLFFQNTLPNVRLRPDHLLQPERFEFYLDCYRNNIKPFNKGYKKTNDKTGML